MDSPFWFLCNFLFLFNYRTTRFGCHDCHPFLSNGHCVGAVHVFQCGHSFLRATISGSSGDTDTTFSSGNWIQNRSLSFASMLQRNRCFRPQTRALDRISSFHQREMQTKSLEKGASKSELLLRWRRQSRRWRRCSGPSGPAQRKTQAPPRHLASHFKFEMKC